jgi:hypothetical protein
MSDNEVGAMRNRLVEEVRHLQQQLMTGRDQFGGLIEMNPEQKRRLQMRIIAQADIANNYHNDVAAPRLGLKKGNLFPDIEISDGIRDEIINTLRGEFRVKNNRDPSRDELKKLYLEQAADLGELTK